MVRRMPAIVHIAGPLQAPLDDDLRQNVRRRLLQGFRDIVVDLADVPAIDAVGIGELIEVYNMAADERAELHIVRAMARVRETLERVGLFDLLSGRQVEYAVPESLS
jgi:anti-anti-sigma factor